MKSSVNLVHFFFQCFNYQPFPPLLLCSCFLCSFCRFVLTNSQAPKARPGEGGNTIDFSTLFAELDSDLSSSDGDSEDDSGSEKGYGDDSDDNSGSVTAVKSTEHDDGGTGGGGAATG